MDVLRDMADRAAVYAGTLGVRYCDVRAEERATVSVRVEDGRAEHSGEESSGGIGVRVAGGSWGFASVSRPGSFEEVREAVDAAVRGASRGGRGPRLAPVDAAEYGEREQHWPEPAPLLELALDCSDAMSAPSVKKTLVSARGITATKYFASTEGARILQSHSDAVMDMSATARDAGLVRTVTRTEGGRGGREALSGAVDAAAGVSARAAELAGARPAGCEKKTVVMDPDFVALLAHEIFGHPSEADRVMGREMAWAGGAWWAGMLGDAIGSGHLDVFDDPTMPGTLGSYAYDDEGTRSGRTRLVRSGVLESHMHSRQTAAECGVLPTANMRAAGYCHAPLIRMACTCVAAGGWSPGEMVSGVRDGYAIYGMRVPSIDMNRYNWSISCQYARRITDGEEGEMVRDVVVSGTAPEFFASVDACGDDFETRPITNCGKGDPMQPLMMGNGGPSIRGTAVVRSI